ncbi:YjgF-like protein [Corynespora cassiicola Philippines]|uniref:YjgF-like protein n=1 Tax=Corynespora cassiicola Philippines TaxID=1448308 RepID=A0A2T2N9P9_CORCC|nr:YjgF-like protein [Corynespora cassiicola Philippines]
MTDVNKPRTFNPPNVPTPPPTYNQVAVTPLLPTSKLVTLAGQTGLRPDGGGIAADLAGQARQAYVNVANALKAAGATPRDVNFVRHYIVVGEEEGVEVVDRGWGEEWIGFMDREAGGHRPPDTVLGVAGLAKKALLYEVEVTAVVHT